MQHPSGFGGVAHQPMRFGRPQKTRVRIFADPSLSRNLHEVAVEGEFGRIIARTENAPVAGNPKSSALAILSILAVLRQLAGAPTPGT